MENRLNEKINNLSLRVGNNLTIIKSGQETITNNINTKVSNIQNYTLPQLKEDIIKSILGLEAGASINTDDLITIRSLRRDIIKISAYFVIFCIGILVYHIITQNKVIKLLEQKK